MPTADERLALIRAKVERAKQHLRDLEIERDRFLKADPYRVVHERDAETGHHVYRVYDLKTPPGELGLIAGDVIHNLRSALDHLVYALVVANGIDPTGKRAIAFPIHDDAASYVARSGGQIKLASQSAITAINATEPYQGGRGEALWLLHYLDIADKHHALLTSLVNVTGVHLRIPGYWQREFRSSAEISILNLRGVLVEGSVIGTRDPEMKDDGFA